MQAAALVRDARDRAQKMRDEADAAGKQMCRKAEEETLAKRAEMMDQLHIKAEEHTARVMEEAREETDEMIKDVSLRRKIAEKIIIRGLDMQCR